MKRLTLLFAGIASSAAPAGAQEARDPLAVAFFEVCPVLMDGSLVPTDEEAISQLGFRQASDQRGETFLVPLEGHDVRIQIELLAPERCPVFLTGTSPEGRIARLESVLTENGLDFTHRESPIGGGLVSVTDPASGQSVMSTQVFENSLLTLVFGNR